ncbi:MAG: GAF domain-containing protein [Bdellovibrionaceae bacterium]|nr:GAF domain-containing protein [Pseudobdellovibrionaceae bacterium]
MSRNLEVRARQTLFIVKKGATKKKIPFPAEWHHCVPSDNAELIDSIQKAEDKRQLVIILVGEKDFTATVETLRKSLGKQSLADLGMLVISENSDPFLTKHSEVLELSDVLSEAALLEDPKFHLLRAVRELLRKARREGKRINQEMLERLNHIFITMSAERDQKRLLEQILQESMDLTSSEKGNLYMVEETDGEMYLRVKISAERNGVSISAINEKATENNICGYVVLTAKPLNIPVHEGLRPSLPLQFQRPADESSLKSVLAVPLKNSENQIIAVLELLNKKGLTGLDSFDAEDESLISSFIAQAAICLENMQLYADIRELFDGFVKASITAIEARDPSTGGHSERVANMTVALAEATSRCDTGIYRSVKFKPDEVRELEYAALLHDVGKIGVREEVLVKAKKLYPYQLEAIRDRVRIAREALRIQFLEQKQKTKSSTLEKEFKKRSEELDLYWHVIQTSNEPTVLREKSAEALEKILNYTVKLSDGYEIRLLTEEEHKALSVPIGSLTEGERREVESHVRHTYQFLKTIPWTRSFKNLPEIAFAHHEKLNGTGYPRGLMSHEIPLQSKIMTIADIYDALTAADRWYKDAVPTEKALDILQQEVTAGKLDPILFEIFIEGKIYESNHPSKVKKVG